MKRIVQFLILLCAGAIGALAGSASADVVHRVAFKAEPVIIVWGARAQAGEISARFPVAKTSADRDWTFDLPGSGRLVSGPAAPASATAPRGAHGSSVFQIASNSAFAIDAVIRSGSPVDGVLTLSLAGIGPSAQHPGPLAADPVRLSSLTAPRRVYESRRRTAATPGSIADQSVTFDAAWPGEAEIVFTVYAP